MPIVPGRGLAPGDGSALLLPGEDGEGEPDVGHDKVHDVVGEAADEVAPADRICKRVSRFILRVNTRVS